MGWRPFCIFHYLTRFSSVSLAYCRHPLAKIWIRALRLIDRAVRVCERRWLGENSMRLLRVWLLILWLLILCALHRVYDTGSLLRMSVNGALQFIHRIQSFREILICTRVGFWIWIHSRWSKNDVMMIGEKATRNCWHWLCRIEPMVRSVWIVERR